MRHSVHCGSERIIHTMITIVLILTLQFALYSCHAIAEPENAFPALESSWKGQGDEEVDVIGDLTIYR